MVIHRNPSQRIRFNPYKLHHLVDYQSARITTPFFLRHQLTFLSFVAYFYRGEKSFLIILSKIALLLLKHEIAFYSAAHTLSLIFFVAVGVRQLFRYFLSLVSRWAYFGISRQSLL